MNLTAILLATWPWNTALVLAAIAAGSVFWALTRGRRADAHFGRLVAALALLVLALSSPMDALAEGCLFSAHMVQHLLLLVMVPALFVLSLPPTKLVARVVPNPLDDGPPSAPPSALGTTRATLGWVCGIGAMWFWHVPALCDAASASTAIHGVQSLSLLAAGSLFWWPIFSPNPSSRLGPWAGIAYLFTACLACTALGILLTLTPVELCPVFRAPVDRFGLLPTIRGPWGISAALDRAAGGLLMWVPMCAIYVSAILLELGRWYGAASPSRREALP